MALLLFCCAIVLPIAVLHSAPLPSPVPAYLRKFGFLDEAQGDVRGAVAAFQTEVGLRPSGELSRATLALMSEPRCGLVDHPSLRRRRKRFVPHSLKWPSNTLGWRLDDPYGLLRPLDKKVVRRTLEKALGAWSTASRGVLRFAERSDEEPADIEVFFATGPHNDSLPFDGASGVVAHGFYPTQGKLHFDASERWTLKLDKGINLYQTAVHEIGHLLGLEHSSDSRAVMYPINRSYSSAFRLADDDVRGIRFLYSPWPWRVFFNRYLTDVYRRSEGL